MDSDIIERYYTNLDYVKPRSNKSEASISALIRNVKLEGDNFLDRCADTIDWMKENLALFQSVCNHRDVPRYIIHFLYAYPTMVKSHDFTSEKNKQEVWTTMLTLLSYCAKPEIQHFLETCLM